MLTEKVKIPTAMDLLGAQPHVGANCRGNDPDNSTGGTNGGAKPN